MEKKCIRCGGVVTTRGLCRKHYVQFNKAKAKAEKKGVSLETFDEMAVKRGLILPNEKLQLDDYDLLVEELASKTYSGTGIAVSERARTLTDCELAEMAERDAKQVAKKAAPRASKSKKADR